MNAINWFIDCRERCGGKRGSIMDEYIGGIIVGAIILLVLSVLGMFAYFDKRRALENIDTTIASFIVDLTMIYLLWVVISSTRKIRELNLLHTQE